jgi:succinate-acetate transporter protein
MGITEKLANPAPLGLLGFGLTTVLLNLHNAGFFPLDTMIVAMGLAYGGLAQIIVGAMEFRRGNTFGMVAFTSYGLFWWSLVATLVLPRLSFFNVASVTAINAPTHEALAAYFFMWGLFTFGMLLGTLKTNRALQFVFASLGILFFMLVAAELTGDATVTMMAGYEGVVCGLSAVYLGIAEVINETYGKTVLPTFPTK